VNTGCKKEKGKLEIIVSFISGTIKSLDGHETVPSRFLSPKLVLTTTGIFEAFFFADAYANSVKPEWSHPEVRPRRVPSVRASWIQELSSCCRNFVVFFRECLCNM
jgi:hypothetical protein